VGAFFKQKSDDIATVELNTPAPGIQRDSDDNEVDNESWAAFTQWTWRPRRRLVIVARYTRDESSYPDQFDTGAGRQAGLVRGIAIPPRSRHRPRSTSLVAPGDAYFSYSEGFMGGGWNSHFNSVLTNFFTLEQIRTFQEFQQEEARTYELGAKFDLLQNTLRLNAAVFRSDYTDMQLTYRGPVFPPPTPAGVAPFVTKAGKASIQGAELEVTWAPTAALRADASVGYLTPRSTNWMTSHWSCIPGGWQRAALRAGVAGPRRPPTRRTVGAGRSRRGGCCTRARPSSMRRTRPRSPSSAVNGTQCPGGLRKEQGARIGPRSASTTPRTSSTVLPAPH
jgi:outer membrane receptor protein involved in Fe transport